MLLVTCLNFCAAGKSIAQTQSELELAFADEEELAFAYGGEELVSIATGSQQPVYLAPSVTSLITADDIKEMGATDLDEILETVPGLHVSRSSTYNPIYQIRGITSDFNPQVLVLINGIPITNVFAGNRGQVWGGMPVQNIERVEVIRGPGSALYGADAFAGVINIITKNADDIDGVELGVRAGSFDSKEAWFLYGGDWSGFDVAFSFQYAETDGQNQRIGSDAQSVFDNLFVTNASLAPDSVNRHRHRLDTRLDFSKGDWRFRFGYQGRYNVGTGAGAAEALDPEGRADSDRFNADLTFENDSWFDDWELQAQFSFFNTSNRSNLVLFPPGSFFAGSFPSGVIGNPDVYERHYRINFSSLYSGFHDHRIRFGAGFRSEDLYRVEETKNFSIPINLPMPRPGGLVNVTDREAFVREVDREIWFAFLQDEWHFLSDWNLTGGIRFDHYSDFGNTVNPRFALVWQTAYNLTSKLLYGRAFRAPSFMEQFNENNPIAQGNSDLDPETINSVELAFDYLPVSRLRTKLNLFFYEADDILRFITGTNNINTAQNSGSQTAYGLEFESSWAATDFLEIQGNYSYQKSRDNSDNSDVGFAPSQQIYGRADWQFFRGWNIDLQANWVGVRKRSPGDQRNEIDDYVKVDLTLRGEIPGKYGEVAFSIRNLFDEDIREPSLFNRNLGALIANDLPLAGQSLFFEVRLNLD